MTGVDPIITIKGIRIGEFLDHGEAVGANGLVFVIRTYLLYNYSVALFWTSQGMPCLVKALSEASYICGPPPPPPTAPRNVAYVFKFAGPLKGLTAWTPWTPHSTTPHYIQCFNWAPPPIRAVGDEFSASKYYCATTNGSNFTNLGGPITKPLIDQGDLYKLQGRICDLNTLTRLPLKKGPKHYYDGYCGSPASP